MKESLTRRDFVKVAGAAAMTLAAMPGAAFAADAVPASTAGTYKIDANLYVPASEHGITNSNVKGKNAYLTNPNNPLTGSYPTNPVSGNGTLVVNDDGGYKLTIPVVNKIFRLVSIAGNSTFDISASGDGSYITEVVLSGTQLPSSGTYVFSECEEFARYLFAYGSHDWKVSLDVDFSPAA